ncbi:hypothetical protein FRB94_014291 [Tulasnella sp. JGI-2019a]|nr:hypothetical protein FRB93_000718 [Tulasnella sp. JGI-2019a]KAG9007522.1 hypothetical protein FRB94_014291 [Tulasnella sp. JGI-2019a]
MAKRLVPDFTRELHRRLGSGTEICHVISRGVPTTDSSKSEVVEAEDLARRFSFTLQFAAAGENTPDLSGPKNMFTEPFIEDPSSWTGGAGWSESLGWYLGAKQTLVLFDTYLRQYGGGKKCHPKVYR